MIKNGTEKQYIQYRLYRPIIIGTTADFLNPYLEQRAIQYQQQKITKKNCHMSYLITFET